MSLFAIAGIAGTALRDLDQHVARMLKDSGQRWVSTADNAAFGGGSTGSPSGHHPCLFRCARSGRLVTADMRLDDGAALRRKLGLVSSGDCAASDGEVVLAAYERWGDGLAIHLRGDFALAIWDPRRRKLFAARDIFGVRPFAYCVGRDDWIAFASDIDALLSWSAVPAEFDRGRLADALVEELEGVYEDATFYQSIKRLPPACSLTFQGGRVEVRRYWLPSDEPLGHLPSSVDEWSEAIRSRLHDAVRRRVLGQGRVGCMLSGGVDSSSVVALASRIFADAGHDELPVLSATHASARGVCRETAAIRIMQGAFPMAAMELDVGAPGELADALRAHLTRFEEPFDGGNLLIVAQYLMAARAGLQVLCDGIDADGLFSEGDLIGRLLRDGQWSRLAAEVHGRASVFGMRPAYYAWIVRRAIGSFVPIGWRQRRHRWQTERSYRGALRDSVIDADFAIEVNAMQRLRDQFAGPARLTPVENPPRHGGYSVVTPFLTQGIDRYQRTSSRLGVAASHPFLDRDLIELCAWVPLDLRTRGGWNKWMLREAMSSVLPSTVAWRAGGEHLGWRLQSIVLGPVIAERLSDPASRTRLSGIVDAKRVAGMLKRWRTGDDRPFDRLSACVLLDIWLEVRERGGRPRQSPDDQIRMD